MKNEKNIITKVSILTVLLTGLFLLIGIKTFSQTEANPRAYQLVFFTEDSKNVFFQGTNIITDSLLVKIEQLRQTEEVVYAKIS
ncbi:MAG: hypothetical protein V2A54_04180, partial [Bacteroidota bacterium]